MRILLAFLLIGGMATTSEAAGLVRGRAAACSQAPAASCAGKTVIRQRVVVLRRAGC